MSSNSNRSKSKKRDFIEILMNMSDTDINDYIKRHGKGPKKVRMIRHINKTKDNK